MSEQALREPSAWLSAGLGLAVVAFGALVLASLDLAVYAGLASTLVLAVSGFRLAAAVNGAPHDDRIGYPYDLAARGRRLAWTALVTALGLAGFGLAPGAIAAYMGRLALIAIGAAALLGPAMVVVLAVWAADGLSLRAGREEPGDPLVAATVSLIVALLLALVTATTGYGASLPVLVALGGLAPSLFAAWSVVRLRGGFPAGHPRA